MTSPWAKIAQPDPVNLEDIMSEEVARDMQEKENKRAHSEQEFLVSSSPNIYDPSSSTSNQIFLSEGSAFDQTSLIEENKIKLKNLADDIPQDVLKALSGDVVDSDAAIAQMLQMQFDKEYDEQLKRTEQKFNRGSKVSISFENYRRTPQNYDFLSDSEEEEIVDVVDRKDWDRFDSMQREVASIPPCGYKVQKNGSMITKHDLANSGRKNACKLLSFPPEFQTGDGENFDLKLSNKVFNSLKMHSTREQVRRHRMHDKKEDHATAEFGLDEFTRLLIYKMINSQLLDRVNGVISIGKEAVILHAETDPSFPLAKEPLPKEVAIKVFKTTLSEFKQRDKYIKDDHRFKDRIGKQSARKTVTIWAEKEMANLMRLKRAGLNCPEVVTLKQHVLVMSFIGEDNRPAPKLKDAILKDVDYIMAYEEIIECMKILYNKANLIHADLSEYNILWHNKQCYFIDVSQSVEPSHENAFHFLYRDCCNVITFFTRKGVSNIATPDELFKHITGAEFDDEMALSNLRESFKMKPHLVDKPGIEFAYNFDTAWEKLESEGLPTVKKVINEDDQLKLVEPPQA